MYIESRNVTISKTARFAFSGNLSNCSDLWYVLHGYGMLAGDFIKNFEPLLKMGAAVVAPEGLHRFYTGGLSGSVGASWMTKEARENDIADYITYLDAVHDQVTNGRKKEMYKVHVLGFSQGAATACRWVASGAVPAVELVLWSGVFPPDLSLENCPDNMRNPGITIVVGREDELVTARRLAEQESMLDKAGIPFSLLRFNGGHEILSQALEMLISKSM